MKKLLALTMLISLAMICSCQKQGTTVEQQLAQRKAELDAREKVLDDREKELALRETVLNERQQALAKKEKPTASVRTINPDVQSPGQVPDLGAEREKTIQQLPPEVRKLIPDPAQVQAERNRRMQQRLDQRKRALEQLQTSRSQMQNQSTMSDAAKQAAIPAATAAPAAVYPGAEATSPNPSPTPE